IRKHDADESQVTVAITYSSADEGHSLPLDELRVNPSKNHSFASFNPAGGFDALGTAVNWLKGYATRHTSVDKDGGHKELPPEYLSILGDFDEIEDHFDNPIEFPLRSILSGRYDPRLLDLYGSLFQITIKKEITIMGDNYQNIGPGAVIINR